MLVRGASCADQEAGTQQSDVMLKVQHGCYNYLSGRSTATCSGFSTVFAATVLKRKSHGRSSKLVAETMGSNIKHFGQQRLPSDTSGYEETQR